MLPRLLLSIFFVTSLFAEDLCSLAPLALSKAEAVRGLKIIRPVKCKVQTKAEVKGYLQDTIDTKIPDLKIKNEEKLYRALGLIPRDYNYKDEIIKLYTSQLAGYYEPVSEYYVMAGWMPEMMQLPIAVHELTHALQDQHYNLDDFLEPKDFTSDELLARSAVVEGDATTVMYDYFNEATGKPRLVEQTDVQGLIFQAVASSKMTAGLKDAPPAMQAFLLFPYTSGLNFSHYFLRRGGYPALDRIFQRLPKTTKEILHPEYYAKAEKFIPLTEEELGHFFKIPDLKISYEDRIGEFILSTLTNLEDQTLASSWLNDLVVIEENSNQVYWLLKLNSLEKAKQLEATMKKINPDGVIQSIVKDKFVGFILK